MWAGGEEERNRSREYCGTGSRGVCARAGSGAFTEVSLRQNISIGRHTARVARTIDWNRSLLEVDAVRVVCGEAPLFCLWVSHEEILGNSTPFASRSESALHVRVYGLGPSTRTGLGVLLASPQVESVLHRAVGGTNRLTLLNSSGERKEGA
jgi:hypothetical protein